MFLKETFNWLNRCIGRQPSAIEIKFSDEVQAKTLDGVFVAIPFQLILTVADKAAYRKTKRGLDKQVVQLTDNAYRTEVAKTTYPGLLTSSDTISSAALTSLKDHIQRDYGLVPASLIAGEVRGPSVPEGWVKTVEEEAAAARVRAKIQADAHASAQELMKGLGTEIQVKRPLSLKKPGQQP